MTLRLLALPAIGIALALASTSAPQTAVAGGHKFVGASTCGGSSCHGSAEKTGNEMKKWSEKDPHSSSFDQLGEEKGMKIAKALGIESPDEDAKCLGCHATGADAAKEMREKTALFEDGVTCEACHGAGGTFKDEKHNKDKAWAIANGMIDLSNKDTRKATCDKCHGSIDEKMVAAGHPKASNYDEREAAYKKFAHWKTK